MATSIVYASRLLKLPLLDNDGATIGHVADLIIGPPARDTAPLLLGLVAQVNRRKIFVAASRIGEIDGAGVRLKTAAVDLRMFQLRVGELLATNLLDAKVTNNEVVLDLALSPCVNAPSAWEVTSVALGARSSLRRRRATRAVPWHEVKDLFDAGEVGDEVAALRSLHPSDMAKAVRKLTAAHRTELANAMEDEDLADLLEEMPESEQARLIVGLDTERAARVLEEMEPDDAADLLSELSGDHRSTLLEAMHPDEADPLRRLLKYDQNSAGGLMTPEPLVLPPEASVAEALARLRNEEVTCAVAAVVFVVQPPTQTPTGTYLGCLTFQELLREPPGRLLGHMVDGQPEPIPPEMGEILVAERLAAYNLLALPVCDSIGRLLGAVTVDDVLDRTLPVGWRSH